MKRTLASIFKVKSRITWAAVLLAFCFAGMDNTASCAYAQEVAGEITFEQTGTGFYYPSRSSENYSNCGNWLARDGAHGGCYSSGLYHTGVDRMSNYNSPVFAISTGVVFSRSNQGWGTGNIGLVIKHKLEDGTEFLALYGHVTSNLQAGDIVTGGVEIARIGHWDDGDHLHFGIQPDTSMPSTNLGRMPNSSWPDTNGFVNPIDWIETKTPKCENGSSERYLPSGRTPIHPNGTIIKVRGNDTVYVIQGGGRKAIPDRRTLNELYGFGRGFDFRDVVTISATELNRYNDAGVVTSPLPHNGRNEPDGRLIRQWGQGEISIVTDGIRRPFATAKAFLNLGYSFCNVAGVSDYHSYTVGRPVEEMFGITASGGPDANPTFNTTASASPNPSALNQLVTITTTVTNTGGVANDVIVDTEIYNSSNQKVFQSLSEHQYFSVNQPLTYTTSWTPTLAGDYRVKVGVFNSSWLVNYTWNESALTFTVGSGTPPPPATYQVEIWWPTNAAQLSGTQPFKAMVTNLSISNYSMFWQVDGGQLNLMNDSYQDYPHKEVIVDLSGWTWRGTGPYRVNFVAKDSTGNIIAQRAVDIYITH